MAAGVAGGERGPRTRSPPGRLTPLPAQGPPALHGKCPGVRVFCPVVEFVIAVDLPRGSFPRDDLGLDVVMAEAMGAEDYTQSERELDSKRSPPTSPPGRAGQGMSTSC